MSAQNQLITDKARSLIGTVNGPVVAWTKISQSEIRRFMQSIPDDDPLYYDDEYAKNTRFGGVVAPPTLPITIMGQRPPGTHDPLPGLADDAGDDTSATSDDLEVGWYLGLRALIAQFPPNMLFFHGGDELEIFQLAQPGDQITCTSEVVDMYEKDGRSGHLGFVVLLYKYVNQRGELLCTSRHTEVLRESKKE